MFHYDHIHVDLARRASGRNVCKPEPMSLPAPAPRLDVPVARAPTPQGPVYAQRELHDPYAVARDGQRTPPVAASPQPRDGTSPWAHSTPQMMQRPAGAMQGPTVIERSEPIRAASGQPLVLGNQAPPAGSFTISERVREALRRDQGQPSSQPQYQPPRPPAPSPAPMQQNPHGLVPPARIPNARLGADPIVTGSIGKPAAEKKPGKTGLPDSTLMNPQRFAEQAPSSEPASVFNLQPARAGK
jgi:hypothetical protein